MTRKEFWSLVVAAPFLILAGLDPIPTGLIIWITALVLLCVMR